MLHAKFDEIVDPEQSLIMKKALKKKKKLVEDKCILAVGHNGWSLENNILYLETIERFLAKHLTGGNPELPEERKGNPRDRC